MDWELRLKALLLAGGTMAALGCSDITNDGSGGVPCGNANPDPCICGRPNASDAAAALCDEAKACQSQGGAFEPFTVNEPDGGVVTLNCAPDAGSDAGH